MELDASSLRAAANTPAVHAAALIVAQKMFAAEYHDFIGPKSEKAMEEIASAAAKLISEYLRRLGQ